MGAELWQELAPLEPSGAIRVPPQGGPGEVGNKSHVLERGNFY